MDNNKNIISFEGHIDKNVVDNILHELKLKLKILNLEVLTRKRIYSASVECLDNIYRHSEIKTNRDKLSEDYPSRFIVKEAQEGYTIEAGNIVQNTEIKDLKGRLEKLNELEPVGVNSLYKDTIMKSAGLSDKGGAGLGLIVVAKTTRKNLFYDFQPLNNKYSYFILKVNIL